MACQTQGHHKFSPEYVIKSQTKLLVDEPMEAHVTIMLRSQNLSYTLSHWCRPQLGFGSHAVQEVLCVTWFLITYFQDYSERTWGALAGIIVLYRVILILMQFLAGRKVSLTGDSDNLNVWFIQARSLYSQYG